MNSTDVHLAYIRWLLARPVFAATVTFNWIGRVALPVAEQKVREFGAWIDRARLGKRFYRSPAEARTKFILIPEKFGDGHPHYHGLIQHPDDRLARHPADNYPALFETAWRAVVPGGSVKIVPLDDEEGWARYCTKETGLNYASVVHSYDHWPSSE
jgi:hypothetical protein